MNLENQTNQINQEETLKWLKDRADIQTTILKYPTAVDLRDWALYESLFHDEINVDFSSVGGPIASVPKEQFVKQVLTLIPGFDATQHQLTNFVIDITGDTADATAYMQAEHFLRTDESEASQTVGGYYTYKLIRCNDINNNTSNNLNWKISSLKLTALWSRGDMSIYEIARDRASKIIK